MEEPSCKNGLTSIMNLPDDCLFFIFQRLNSFYDRESFGLTCRRWLGVQNVSRRSLQFPCSFTHLSVASLSHPNFNINSYHITRILSRFSHLQSLSLSGCIHLNDSGLTALQHYGSSLQSLHFDCCWNITDGGFSLAFAACPSLAVISLYRCNVTDIGLTKLANACPGLKQVNLSYCSLISDLGLTALSQGCRQLQEIRVSFCGNITGVGFANCSPTLAHVEAVSCKNILPEGVKAILSGGGIEFLDLTSLSWRVGSDGLAAMGTGFALGLKFLNLRLCRSVGDESISAISKGCLLLQEWSLTLCDEVKLPGWISIGANCNNLEKLHVNRCRNLCDQGLLALRNGCRRLTVLYMTRCLRLTPTAIEMFKCYRSNVTIKEEDIVSIGPRMAFR